MTTLTPSETAQDEALRIYNETYSGAYALHLARVYDQQWRREEIWRWRDRRGAADSLGAGSLVLVVFCTLFAVACEWLAVGVYAGMLAYPLTIARGIYCEDRLRELGEPAR